jgi:hypothetical protein
MPVHGIASKLPKNPEARSTPNISIPAITITYATYKWMSEGVV